MLAIIADDLTGALDTAAPFASRGLHCEVALRANAIPAALAHNPQVLSVDTGSRDMDPAAARKATAAVLAQLPAGSVLFKKVDSRLKGHIAAELDVTPYRSALVAPAIPDFGRVAEAGHLKGFGVDTAISIAETLGRHASLAMIPDTRSQDEMSEGLAKAQEAGVDLLVGARGLAEALAQQMTEKTPARLTDIPTGPSLFVVGSRDPITLAQIRELRAAHAVRYLPAPNGELNNALPDGSLITLVQAVPGSEPETGQNVSKRLAASVCPALTAAASTLLLSGGATAGAVLETMSITHFRLIGECMPGMGLAHADGRCIIAKSGGFGTPGTLKKIADIIRRNAR